MAVVGIEGRAERAVARAGGFPLFDGLRFGLASVVVLTHGGVITWPWAGYLAVQVFFALSGWLIGGILLRTDRADLPRFFFNRGTRIWIPYFLAVALLYSISALRDLVDPRWLEYLAFDLTFTHNLFSLKPAAEVALPLMPLRGTGNHFWSISVEEQFYLGAPLVILFARAGRTVWLWAGIAAVAVLSASWFGAISLGVLAAVARARHGDWHLVPVHRAAILALLLVSGVALAMPGAPVTRIAPVFALCAVLALAVPGQRSGLGELLGGLSFPLYLNHWFFFFLFHASLKQLGGEMTVGADLLAYGAAVLGGGMHYLLIDRMILRHRGRFYSPAAGRAFQYSAYALFTAGLVLGLLLWRTPFWG